jgi:hypothetical protein
MLNHREAAKNDLISYLSKAIPGLKVTGDYRTKIDGIIDNIIAAAVIEARKSLKDDVKAAMVEALAEEGHRKEALDMFHSNIEARRAERRMPRGGS